MQWLKPPAWKVGDRGFEPHSGLQVSKNVTSSLARNDSIMCGTSMAEMASNRQGPNFESYVSRPVSSHHPQEVLMAQFSLYVHKGGLKPHSFNLIYCPIISLHFL